MATAGNPPTVWVMHDGKIGMANQVVGLAEALGWPFVEKRLVIRSPWRHLTPSLWLWPMKAIDPSGAVLTPPWPDILIACVGAAEFRRTRRAFPRQDAPREV